MNYSASATIVFAVTIACLLLQVKVLQAFSGGAPCSTVDNFVLDHDEISAQDSPSPYTIEVSPTCYQRNKPLTVILKGPKGFTGFVLQARNSVTDKLVNGRFYHNETAQGKNYDWKYQCPDKQSSITQKSFSYIDKIDVQWYAPIHGRRSRIYFVSSVVESYSKFWVRDPVSTVVAPC